MLALNYCNYRFEIPCMQIRFIYRELRYPLDANFTKNNVTQKSMLNSQINNFDVMK